LVTKRRQVWIQPAALELGQQQGQLALGTADGERRAEEEDPRQTTASS
jgi:hypothetical protein